MDNAWRHTQRGAAGAILWHRRERVGESWVVRVHYPEDKPECQAGLGNPGMASAPGTPNLILLLL